MMRARAACVTLVACGVVVAGTTSALAAGEQIDTTVSLKKATAIKKNKPGQLKLSWSADIAKPDGSRAANLSGGQLTLPKNMAIEVAGLKPCPLAKLEANDNKSCPKESVVGSSAGTIYSSPIREQPYDADGILYYTGGKANRAKFAAYYTLKEIPSAHSITPLTVTKKSISFVEPRIPTAPGLPDATVLHIDFNFDKKGPKGYVFRTTKACKKGTALETSFTFFDGSSTDGTGATC